MRHLLLLSATLLPCLTHAATFQSFDVPGAYGTCGSAIASTGLVAGTTTVPVSVGTNSRTTAPTVKPFLYAGGQLFYPHNGLPAGTVTFTGVNKDRFITGNAFNGDITNPVSINFVDHRGMIAIPTAGTLPITVFSGITDGRVLLGQATVKTSLGGGFYWDRNVGFLLSPGGAVTPIDDGSSSLIPRGMDAKADRVVGLGPGREFGWLRIYRRRLHAGDFPRRCLHGAGGRR